MGLRQLTEAEIAASNLRRIARDLILEAERLEASVGHSDKKVQSGPRKRYVNRVTGKKETIDNSKRL